MNLAAVSENLAAISAELQAEVSRPMAIHQPTINPGLMQVFQDWGVAGLLTQLRDYCHMQGESSWDSGYTGAGWYDMHDRIDNIIPAGKDADLDGDPVDNKPAFVSFNPSAWRRS